MAKRIRPEDKAALVELVQEEIRLHRADTSYHLSTNPELCDLIVLSKMRVSMLLNACLSEQDRIYRAKGIHSQNGKRVAELGIGVCGLSREERVENGKKAARLGAGFHSMSHEQRVELGRRSGLKTAELGLGIHGISHEQRVEIGRRSGSKSAKLGRGIHGMIYEQRVEIGRRNAYLGVGAHGLSHEQKVENGRRLAELGIGVCGLSREERVENGKKAARLGAGFHSMSHEQRQEIGSKTAEAHRKNAYFVERRFYASSQQEGAVALLLEKYIPQFRVTEGVNFQVRDRGLRNGGIDFLVERNFVEWHPIVLYSGRRGDIPEGELLHYKKARQRLANGELRKFNSDYAEVLMMRYWKERQEQSDASEYRLPVTVVTKPEELYSLMAMHTSTLPQLEQFKSEFNAALRYVKKFKVNAEAN